MSHLIVQSLSYDRNPEGALNIIMEFLIAVIDRIAEVVMNIDCQIKMPQLAKLLSRFHTLL